MSSGVFTNSRYETNAGAIHRIRVQPETLTASIGSANAAPTGTIDSAGTVRVGGGNREFGIKARSVTLRWTTNPPGGYAENQYIRLPILTETLYDSINLGDTGTYLSTGVTVVGKNPERVR